MAVVCSPASPVSVLWQTDPTGSRQRRSWRPRDFRPRAVKRYLEKAIARFPDYARRDDLRAHLRHQLMDYEIANREHPHEITGAQIARLVFGTPILTRMIARVHPSDQGQLAHLAADALGQMAAELAGAAIDQEPEAGTWCYRHRYLMIFRQRSVSTDRHRSMSISVAHGPSSTPGLRCQHDVAGQPCLRSVTCGGPRAAPDPISVAAEFCFLVLEAGL